MKKQAVLMTAVTLAASLSGCASNGLIAKSFQSFQTPNVSIEACETMRGQELAQVKAKLFEDPTLEPEIIIDTRDGVGRDYRYRKGNLHARVTVVDGRVANVECWKGIVDTAPSERAEQLRQNQEKIRQRYQEMHGMSQMSTNN